MKLYKVFFSTQHHDGGRIFHSAMVLTRKVRGHNLWKVKWDFSDALDEPDNKSSITCGENALSSVKNFIARDLDFDPTVDIVGWTEIVA